MDYGLAATLRGREGLKNLGRARRPITCTPQTSEAGRKEIRRVPYGGRVAPLTAHEGRLAISSRVLNARAFMGRARWSPVTRISQVAAIGLERLAFEASG